MTSELDLSAVETARQLLAALREITDDYRDVDAAGWKHLTGDRGRTRADVASKHLSEHGDKLIMKLPLYPAEAIALNLATSLPLSTQLFVIATGNLTVEAINARLRWTKFIKDAALAQEFLRAGVHVELALDSRPRDPRRATGAAGAAAALMPRAATRAMRSSGTRAPRRLSTTAISTCASAGPPATWSSARRVRSSTRTPMPSSVNSKTSPPRPRSATFYSRPARRIRRRRPRPVG